MLDKIKALLLQSGLKQTAQPFPERDVAAVALLLEAASADGSYGEAEHLTLCELVARKMVLAPDRAAALLDAARARQNQAVELFRFTDAVNRAMDEGERAALVEMLWEVVYADGVLDAFEDRLIRSVAALLHVPDRTRAEARQRVLARKADGEN